MAPTSPAVARLEFRLRVLRRRKASKLSGDVVAKKLEFSRNHWSAIENGRAVIGQDKLDTLFDLLGFDQRDRDELRDLDAVGRQQGWWEEPSFDVNPVLAELCGYEYGASSIRQFETLTIPGILQTADYARSIISRDPVVGKLDLNRMVELRMKRQSRIVDDDPLQLTVILPEAALWHHVKDPQTQAQQLVHMMDMCAERKNIEMRIIPFERHPGVLATASTLLLLDFESEHLPVVAWQEAFNAVGTVDQMREVERIELAWSEARRISCDPDESFAKIEAAAEKISSGITRP